jgi:hypothetical protein
MLKIGRKTTLLQPKSTGIFARHPRQSRAAGPAKRFLRPARTPGSPFFRPWMLEGGSWDSQNLRRQSRTPEVRFLKKKWGQTVLIWLFFFFFYNGDIVLKGFYEDWQKKLLKKY